MGSLPDDLRVELSGLCQQRASLYGLLSRLYSKEVDDVVLADLKKTAFPAKTGNDLVDMGYCKLATYLSGDTKNAVLELSIDFVKTFFGHGNFLFSAAYPFESVYTSEKRLMMQEARDDVLAAYRAAGFVIDPNWKEPEDHIAVELLFMKTMCESTQKALDEGDEDAALELISNQRDFFQQHLAAWAPMMTTDMKRLAKTEFYQGLAYLTEGFLQVDRGFLESVISH